MGFEGIEQCNLTKALLYDSFNNTKWTKERIISFLKNKDDKNIETYLSFLSSYGMLNSLVGLKLIVDSFGTSDIQVWLDSKLRALDEYDLISDLAQKAIDKYGNVNVLRNMDLCTFIWENISEEYLDSIGHLDSKILGIWHLGVYKERFSEKYLAGLEETAFPFLIMKSKDIKDNSKISEIEKSIFLGLLDEYMCEILSLVVSYLSDATRVLLKEKVSDIAADDTGVFYDLVCKCIHEDDANIYASRELIDQYEKLIRIYGHYEFPHKDNNVETFKSVIPLLYLFIGDNDRAYEELLQRLTSPLVTCKDSAIYLVEAYRCLLVTKKEEKRHILINVLDGVYTTNQFAAINEYADLFRDVSDFFNAWIKRIKANPLLPKEPEFDEFCDEYIRSDIIADKFCELNKVLYADDPIVRLKAVNDSFMLVGGLSSHDDTVIRILTNDIKRAFGKEDPKHLDEIFWENLYTDDELVTLRRLKNRLTDIFHRIIGNDSVGDYLDIRDNVFSYWSKSEADVLCKKLLIALRGIQSDPDLIWKSAKESTPCSENFLNDVVALCLKGVYGENNVKREDQQGYSSSAKSKGELDIVIYNDNEEQLAIQEALKVTSLDTSRLNEHLDKLMTNYDTRGVGIKVLTVYAYMITDAEKFYDGFEKYLGDYLGQDKYKNYHFENPVRIDSVESSIVHFKSGYSTEGKDKELHAFAVLMKKA